MHTTEKESILNLSERSFDSSATLGYIIWLELMFETFCAILISGIFEQGISEGGTLKSELPKILDISFLHIDLGLLIFIAVDLDSLKYNSLSEDNFKECHPS